MVIHTCNNCEKQFNKKSTYINHINKKNPCKKIINKESNKIIETPNKNMCKHYSKIFSTSSNLSKHLRLKSCKVIKLENEKKQNICNNQVENDERNIKMLSLFKEREEIIQKQHEELKKQNKELYEVHKELNEVHKELNEVYKELLKGRIEHITNMNIFLEKFEQYNLIIDQNKIKNKPPDLIINNEVVLYRESDKYVNATQLCKAGNKKFNDWYELDSTKEILQELIKSSKNPDTKLSISVTSIQNKFIEYDKEKNDINNKIIWIHPDLAIQLVQWISPKFAILFSGWIRALFSNNKVETNLELLKEKDKRIKLLENITLQKQKRTDYPESNVIYLLTTKDNKKKRIYIVGKAKVLKERLSTLPLQGLKTLNVFK